jgi:hypothetical protein
MQDRWTNQVKRLAHLAALALFFAAAGLLIIAVSAQSSASGTPGPGNGTLTISVPYEHIGIIAWAYLDGKLVITPPRGNLAEIYFWDNNCNGWKFTDENRLTLTTCLGKYENLASYLEKASAYGKNLFRTWDISVPAGKHTVEAAFLWQGTQCDRTHPAETSFFPYAKRTHPAEAGFFPFVFSAKYTATVISGKKTDIYVAPPDGYDLAYPMPVAPAAIAAGCHLVYKGQPSEDSLGEFNNALNEFEKDPRVAALLLAAASNAADPRGAVELDLPADWGGPHEFNGAQIHYIVESALRTQRLWRVMPSSSDVAECRQKYPDFAPTFDKYDRLINFVEGQLMAIDKLETSLDQSR